MKRATWKNDPLLGHKREMRKIVYHDDRGRGRCPKAKKKNKKSQLCCSCRRVSAFETRRPATTAHVPLVILACPIPKSSLISLMANRANIRNDVKSESSCEVKKYVNASLRLDWNLWFIIFVYRCSQSLKMAAWDEHFDFGAKSTVISHFFGECIYS